jgi:L-aspartate oxidase
LAIDCDFLVIGAGVAGMRAAIELAQAGSVLVIAKDSLRESSSEYAQGGIAAALNDDDRVALHEQDTIYAGDGLCNVEAVHALVEEAPAAIQELIEWGAEFDREPGGEGSKLVFAREGAHSRNRVLHAHGDSTGHEIARTLYRKAASLPHVRFETFSAVADLLITSDGVGGAVALDEGTSQMHEVRARAVLLATGGLGCVFRETTNPAVATGDGVAMAWRAGAEISNMEFVQFHPTALHIDGAPRFLLSEALRGEGAVLRNRNGEAFMERYHEMRDLAPRDVVSRAIITEIQRTGSPHVWLDLTARGSAFIHERFPRIYETCLRYGLDLGREAAPVHPAAHYAMGGVRSDAEGRTSISGLYVAGEVACTGVHGANRLASNSLLEGLVFGARAGRTMRHSAPASGTGAHPTWQVPEVRVEQLRDLAWNDCGIVRHRIGLESAIRALTGMKLHKVERPTLPDIELRSIFDCTSLIAQTALWREESRGAHYRTDFPTRRAEFERDSSSVISVIPRVPA